MLLNRSVFILLLIFFLAHSKLNAQAEMPRLMIDPQGHSAMISEMIVTHDGKTLITTSRDKSLRFWELESGHLLRTVRLHIADNYNGTITCAALSPDEKYLAVAVVGTVMDLYDYIAIINLDDFKQVGQLYAPDKAIDQFRDICFSPDGKYLACAHGQNVVIYRMPGDTTAYVNGLKTWVLIGHSNSVSSLAFSPDGKKLVSASFDYTIKLWNLSKLAAGFMPTELKTLYSHKKEVLKVAFTPDGKFLLSGGKDDCLFLWDSYGNFVKGLAILENGVYTLSVSQDGSQVFIMNDQQAMIINIFSGKLLCSLKANVQTMNYMGCYLPLKTFPDESDFMVAAATKDHSINIINLRTGKIFRKLQGNAVPVHSVGFGKNMLLAFGKAGNQLSDKAIVNFDKAFDFSQMKLIPSSARLDKNPAVYSGNIREYRGITIKLRHYYELQLSNGKKIKLEDSLTNEICSYSFSPDGKILVGTMFYINVYNTEGDLVTKLLGHVGPVQAMAISPDKKYLASGGADGTIMLWNLEDLEFSPEITSIIPGGLAAKYKFLPGDLIIAVNGQSIHSFDDFIKLLKTAGTFNFSISRNSKIINIAVVKRNESFGFKFDYEKKPLLSLFAGSDGEWVCYSPHGYFACSPSGGKYIIWHINRGYNQLGLDFEAGQLFNKYYHPEVISEIFTNRTNDEVLLKSNHESDISSTLKAVPGLTLSLPSAASFKCIKTNRFAETINSTSVDSIQIQIEARDEGGGISKVLIYQNDKLIDIRKPNKNINSGKKILYSYNLRLLPGENKISAVALSNDQFESTPEEIKIICNVNARQANLYILAVGINNYKNPAYNLKFAVPDADSFVSELISNSGKIFGVVVKKELLNEEATKQNLYKAIAGFKSVIEPQDVFVFYFSGHGTVNSAADVDSADFFLVMSDVNKLYGDDGVLKKLAVSSRELNEFSATIKAQKQLIILDACQSGGATKSFVSKGMAEERAIAQLARSAGIVVLAASGVDQYAAEYNSLGHGIFTYSLLEGLKGKADGINSDQKITVFELKAWVDDQVPELTKKYTGREQYPTAFSRGQDFPLKMLTH